MKKNILKNYQLTRLLGATVVFISIISINSYISIGSSYAQETATVEVKGVGPTRDEAVQDGLRAAVGKAFGTYVESTTIVENYITVKDAIATNTKGYITSYEVLKETPLTDRVEVLIQATVSLSPLKQDAQTLAQWLGGLRFLVLYDSRELSEEELVYYDFAYERFNEKLAENQYRYIEKSRFDALKEEAYNILTDDKSEASYVQKLGLFADAEFLIFIKKIHIRTEDKAGGLIGAKVTIEGKAYDNCTAEGLGTVILESEMKIMKNKDEAIRLGISDAINNGYARLMYMFNSYAGNWLNSGAPFELRFYLTGTYRDFRDLKNKLKEDTDFGGQMEVISVHNYSKLICTFKKKQDENL